MRRIAIICLLCCFLVSCKSANNQSVNSILDETLRSSFSKLEASKSRAKSVLLFDNEKSAYDCISYLELTKGSRILDTIENQLVKNEYLICDALSAISRFGLGRRKEIVPPDCAGFGCVCKAHPPV
ncbi:MAG: hypothetical protein KJP07_09170, partial [Desulfatitalea sp.]|nr:hypothetical protein [Desulfatitalea sp.]